MLEQKQPLMRLFLCLELSRPRPGFLHLELVPAEAGMHAGFNWLQFRPGSS
jgi:hypothetical protein